MPIYEYQCDCGVVSEVLTFRTTPPPTHCGKEMLKLISRPGHFSFKGEGFYATDYGNQPDGLSSSQQQIRAKREILSTGGRLPQIPREA